MSLWLSFGKSKTEFPLRVVSVCPNWFYSVLFFLVISVFGRSAAEASGITPIEKGSTTISTLAPTGSSPFRWGAQVGGGFTLASRGSLSQQFRFPFQIEGSALACYESLVFGARIGMAFGSSQNASDQSSQTWQKRDRAEALHGHFFLMTKVYSHRRFSAWPWMGVGLSAIDVYTKPNAYPVHSGYKPFFPLGIQFRYAIAKKADEAPFSMFLQYHFAEKQAFGYRSASHHVVAGIWLQGWW